MKILTVVGARPQFVKAAMVSRAIREHNECGAQRIDEVLIHTGQHFDARMSDVFFTELGLPEPTRNLEIAGLSHGAMTGRMLEKIEEVLQNEAPEWVVVYGDTNSTLAAALAAAKLHIPVAHVEAGLRSFNRRMPEEVNRVVTDHISTLLLCPTQTAVAHLAAEGIHRGVIQVGDVMYDAALFYRDHAIQRYPLEQWRVCPGEYALCTIHRAENTDDPVVFARIWEALREIGRRMPVLFLVHPRTRELARRNAAEMPADGVRLMDPLSYLETMRLLMSAGIVLTDSGGLQKEAYFHQVPCLTLRGETEWVETVDLGWNSVCGGSVDAILNGWHQQMNGATRQSASPYGDGQAARQIVSALLRGP